MFPIKSKKSEHHRWVLHIWISLGTKFQVKQKIFSFWIKFAQKGYFWSKTEEMNVIIEFYIFELDQVSNFNLSWQFWFFLDQICPKTVFPVVNRKSEHYHWILRTWISLNIKFQVKLTKFIFWTKFALKVYFRSKKKKVNLTIEFGIFELV